MKLGPECQLGVAGTAAASKGSSSISEDLSAAII